MKVSYQYRKEDYIKALSLLYANRQRDKTILRTFLMFAVGCSIYLSTAALRGKLSQNDIPSYLAGAFVFVFLFLLDNPRILPSLLFGKNLISGKIPQDVIGRHEMEADDDMITFRTPSVEHRVRYGNLSRLSAVSDAVLIYLLDGSAEYIPSRAFEENDGFKSSINRLKQRIISGKDAATAQSPLPSYEDEGVKTVQHTISLEQYLQINALHEKFNRKFRRKDMKVLIWAGIVLWIGLGSVKGLADLLGGMQSPMGIVYLYYALGILALPFGLLLLYRPVWLVNWVLSKKLQMNQFPAGFFDLRILQWNSDWIAHAYGTTGVKLAWSYFSDVLTDGRYALFYQHNQLVMFVYLPSLGDAAENLLDEAVRQVRINRV